MGKEDLLESVTPPVRSLSTEKIFKVLKSEKLRKVWVKRSQSLKEKTKVLSISLIFKKLLWRLNYKYINVLLIHHTCINFILRRQGLERSNFCSLLIEQAKRILFANKQARSPLILLTKIKNQIEHLSGSCKLNLK